MEDLFSPEVVKQVKQRLLDNQEDALIPKVDIVLADLKDRFGGMDPDPSKRSSVEQAVLNVKGNQREQPGGNSSPSLVERAASAAGMFGTAAQGVGNAIMAPKDVPSLGPITDALKGNLSSNYLQQPEAKSAYGRNIDRWDKANLQNQQKLAGTNPEWVDATAQVAGSTAVALPAFALAGSAVNAVTTAMTPYYLRMAATFGLGNYGMSRKGTGVSDTAQGIGMGATLGPIGAVNNPFVRRVLGAALFGAPGAADIAQNGLTQKKGVETASSMLIGGWAAGKSPVRGSAPLESVDTKDLVRTEFPPFNAEARTPDTTVTRVPQGEIGYQLKLTSAEQRLLPAPETILLEFNNANRTFEVREDGQIGVQSKMNLREPGTFTPKEDMNAYMQSAQGKVLTALWGQGRATVFPTTPEQVKWAEFQGLKEHPELPGVWVSPEFKSLPPMAPVDFALSELQRVSGKILDMPQGKETIKAISQPLADVLLKGKNGKIPQRAERYVSMVAARMTDFMLDPTRVRAGALFEQLFDLQGRLGQAQVITPEQVELMRGAKKEATPRKKKVGLPVAVPAVVAPDVAAKVWTDGEIKKRMQEQQEVLDMLKEDPETPKELIASVEQDLMDLGEKAVVNEGTPETPIVEVPTKTLNPFQKSTAPTETGNPEIKRLASSFEKFRQKSQEAKVVEDAAPDPRDMTALTAADERVVYQLLADGKNPLLDGPLFFDKTAAIEYQKTAKKILKKEGLFDKPEANISVKNLPIKTLELEKNLLNSFPNSQIVKMDKTTYLITLPNGKLILIETEQKTIEFDLKKVLKDWKIDPNKAKNVNVVGSYTPSTSKKFGLIELIEGANTGVLKHEQFHALMDLVFEPKDREAIIKRYGSSEKAAEAFRRREAKSDTWMDKIYAFIDKIQRALFGDVIPKNVGNTLYSGIPFDKVLPAIKDTLRFVEKYDAKLGAEWAKLTEELMKKTRYALKDMPVWFKAGFRFEWINFEKPLAEFEMMKALYEDAETVKREIETIVGMGDIPTADRVFIGERLMTGEIDPATSEKAMLEYPRVLDVYGSAARATTLLRKNLGMPYNENNLNNPEIPWTHRRFLASAHKTKEHTNAIVYGDRVFYTAAGAHDADKLGITNKYIVVNPETGSIVTQKYVDKDSKVVTKKKAAFNNREDAERFMKERGLTDTFVQQAQIRGPKLFKTNTQARQFIDKAVETYPDLLLKGSLDKNTPGFDDKLLKLVEIAKSVDESFGKTEDGKTDVNRLFSELPNIISRSRTHGGLIIKEPMGLKDLRKMEVVADIISLANDLKIDQQYTAKIAFFQGLQGMTGNKGNPVVSAEHQPGMVPWSMTGITFKPGEVYAMKELKTLSEGFVDPEFAQILRVTMGDKSSFAAKFEEVYLKASMTRLSNRLLTVYNPDRYAKAQLEAYINLFAHDAKKFANVLTPTYWNFQRDLYKWHKGILEPEKMEPFNLLHKYGIRSEQDSSMHNILNNLYVDPTKMQGEIGEDFDYVLQDAAESYYEKLKAKGVAFDKKALSIYGLSDYMTKMYSAAYDMGYYRGMTDDVGPIYTPQEARQRMQKAFFDYKDVPPAFRHTSSFMPLKPIVVYNGGKIINTMMKSGPISAMIKIAALNAAMVSLGSFFIKKDPIAKQMYDLMDKLSEKNRDRFKIITPIKVGNNNVTVSMRWMFDYLMRDQFEAQFQGKRGPAGVITDNLAVFPRTAIAAVSGSNAFGTSVIRDGMTWQQSMAARAFLATENLPGFYGSIWTQLYKNSQKPESWQRPWWDIAVTQPFLGVSTENIPLKAYWMMKYKEKDDATFARYQLNDAIKKAEKKAKRNPFVKNASRMADEINK